MYFADFFRNLWRKANIGVIIWLVLNLVMICMLFASMFDNYGFLIGPAVWLASVALALSPVGEWILRVSSGCHEARSQQDIGIIASIVSRSIGALLATFLTDILLGFFIWAWTQLGILCVRSSGRKNEFEADAYAKQLGYGQHLEYALEALDRGGRSHGFFAALRATHPRTSDRCAYLAA